MGKNLVHTTAYHPQSNGVVERMQSTLVGILRKAIAVSFDWVDQISFALLATGLSLYELVWVVTSELHLIFYIVDGY